MSYQAEKFGTARRALMLPHSQGESQSISDCFGEIHLGLNHFDDESISQPDVRGMLAKLRELMDTTGIEDPSGQRGTWAVKADSFTIDDKIELSRIVDELAWWFAEGLEATK